MLSYFDYEINKRQVAHLINKKIIPEDIISLYFHQIPKNFFFVQIGANDGRKNDPIYNFVTKYSLSGILIEPQKEVFEKLKKNYAAYNNLIFDNVAISNKDGVQRIYSIKKSFQEIYNKELGDDAASIASFKKSHIVKHLKRHEDFFRDKNIDDYIEEIEIESLSFASLIKKHNIKNIDVLQIDTEGFDFEIIKMFNFELFSPSLICYENKHLSEKEQKECIKLLENENYKLFIGKKDTCAFKLI